MNNLVISALSIAIMMLTAGVGILSSDVTTMQKHILGLNLRVLELEETVFGENLPLLQRNSLIQVLDKNDTDFESPVIGWPKLRITTFLVERHDVLKFCGMPPLGNQRVGCAKPDLNARICSVYIQAELEPEFENYARWHETQHCLGRAHKGLNDFQRYFDEWQEWKRDTK